MRKFFTLFFVALFSLSMWGNNTSSTFYLAVDAATVGSNCETLQFCIKYGGGDNEWTSWLNMTKENHTYNGKLVYSATYEFPYDGYHNWQWIWGGKMQKQWYAGEWNTDLHVGDIYDYEEETWVESGFAFDASYTVYFVNSYSWTPGNVKAYAYNSTCDEVADWAGVATTKLENNWYGYTVHSVTLNKRYKYVIFNNGNSGAGNQTDALEIDQDNLYFYNGTWYASLAAIPTPTIKVSANWGASNAWEDLTLTEDDGGLTASASKTFATTQLNTYQLGVKIDNNWKSNGSSENISRTNNEIVITGTSDNMNILIDVVEEITFTWTYATHTLTVSYPNLPATPVITAKGYWSSAIVEFTPAQDGKSASWSKKNMVKGTYTFYILHNGSKRCLDGDGSSRYVFYRNANSATITGCGTKDDMILNTDIPGEYTLTWNYADNLLTITYPDSLEVEYHLNFKWGEDNWELKKLTDSSDSWFTTNLNISETGTYKYQIRKYDPNENTPTTTWYGPQDDGATMTFNNCTDWQLAANNYLVNLDANSTGDYTFEFNTATAKMNVIYPSATALDEATDSKKAVKRIVNGQLVIEREGKLYNALGAEVK